ncbi:MAG TPA: tRNA lysidine(34) synthetase TilS [Clostridiaceae bacterium]|nr:tRNA lysidine(34) synthetase TilS [Clostridiaceae bacterium]
MIEEFSGQFIKIKNYCQEHNLINKRTVVIIALSGGIDSIYLLHFFIWLQQRNIYKMDLVAAHLNHQIREEADQDQAFVVNLCSELNIPLYVKKVNIPVLAEQRQKGEEEAGRYARYAFFAELVEQIKTDKLYTDHDIKVALGHHQDDLAESVVMNIGRGTGLAGLSTLRIQENYLIRPLLCVSKREICELVADQNWSWVEDHTNQSDYYLRNRIRNQLLPLWSETVGYDIKPIIARMAHNLNEAEDTLLWIENKIFKDCLMEETILSLRKVKQLPRALFKQVIDHWVQSKISDKILSHSQFEQLWQIVHGEHGNKSINIGDNVRIKRYKSRLILLSE